MCVDRLEYASVMPHWRRPAATMRVRYLAHTELRLAFIQVAEEPGFIYAVSDEALPETLGEAVAMVAKWRSENGEASA